MPTHDTDDWQHVRHPPKYPALSLDALRPLLVFKGPGTDRVIPNEGLTGFKTTGLFDWATAKDRARAENALMVDIIESLMLQYGQKHKNFQPQVSAVLFLLSLYHQGAAPITRPVSKTSSIFSSRMQSALRGSCSYNRWPLPFRKMSDLLN